MLQTPQLMAYDLYQTDIKMESSIYHNTYAPRPLELTLSLALREVGELPEELSRIVVSYCSELVISRNTARSCD